MLLDGIATLGEAGISVVVAAHDVCVLDRDGLVRIERDELGRIVES